MGDGNESKRAKRDSSDERPHSTTRRFVGGGDERNRLPAVDRNNKLHAMCEKLNPLVLAGLSLRALDQLGWIGANLAPTIEVKGLGDGTSKNLRDILREHTCPTGRCCKILMSSTSKPLTSLRYIAV